MIKEIKTEKFEGLAVLVPERAHNFSTAVDSKGKYLNFFIGQYYDGGDDLGGELKLTDDSSMKTRILGKATELTKANLELILPDTFAKRRSSHFQDILKALWCYSINPFGERPINSMFHDMRIRQRIWDRAQANTGTWLILQKL
jgi:hypothetical protein